MNFLLKILVNALEVLITSYLLRKGVYVDGMVSAIVVAAVLVVLNTLVKPVMIILTLPVTILSLGLFLLVINACIILIASAIVPGFHVDGFWWALLFSLILSVINSILQATAGKEQA